MNCPKCKSEDVRIQIASEVEIKDKHHSFIWWLLVGWWWVPIKWIFFTLPALIIAVLKPKKQKAINKQKKLCVCQSCGYSWEIK